MLGYVKLHVLYSASTVTISIVLEEVLAQMLTCSSSPRLRHPCLFSNYQLCLSPSSETLYKSKNNTHIT